MALGKTSGGNTQKSIFVDLKSNANKAGGVGFRETTNRTPTNNPEGAKFTYEYAMHDYVAGRVAGFVAKEEPTYDDPKVKEFIGYGTFSDPEGGPNIVVKFPMASGFGRKLVGLMNASKQSDQVVYLHTNQADAGTKIGDKTLEKPAAYINMRFGDAKGAKVVPVYADENGQPLLDEKGEPVQLAMGVKHDIAKKIIWDFTAADDMTMNTAIALTEHFSKAAQGDHHTAAHDDGGIDLNEAAAAAAPRQ